MGLTAQIYAKVTAGPVVGREFFTPPPKVDSQVVVFEPYEQPLAEESTLALIRLGFSAPRKKLLGNLTAGLQMPREKLEQCFEKLGLNVNVRPAQLLIDDWKKLEAEIKQ